MNLVHGIWIPQHSDDFTQAGNFCLWVETDTPIRQRRRARDGNLHPRHLAHEDLGIFLDQKLKIVMPWGGDFTRVERSANLLLPSANGAPLPSVELLPYMEIDDPEEWEFCSWQIYYYRVPQVIAQLNDIHFHALQGADSFQLGAGLLFWWQYTQELKRLIEADQYIPALRYRELGSKRKGADFELYAGWELCSQAYESLVERYAACMPAVCRAGADQPGEREIYTAESLLRHFSDCLLHDVVLSTPSTAKLDKQLSGSMLYDCLHPSKPVPASEIALEVYRDWAQWRAKLTETQVTAGFTLGFRLLDATGPDADDWQLQFLVVSKQDRSLQLSLAGYWSLDDSERQALIRLLGKDFERHLLLALGYAARIYPRIWDGLETATPVGLQMTLDETYAFLKEHAWVLEDAGYIVSVPSWWTREGRRRARVRLTTKSTASSAGAKSYFSLDSVVEFKYQLSIDGQPVSEAEWRQLVSAKTSLVQFRGQWMELNREHMQHMLAEWRETQGRQPEMTLQDLMKMAAEHDDDLEWDHDAGLREVLAALSEKSAPGVVEDVPNFRGDLREYQKRGVAWLRYLERLHLNPCLADDMGLGKTIQVIAQLVAERNEGESIPPTLLIAPTSVLGNWRKEIERFAPQLRVLPHHGSTRARDAGSLSAACSEADVVITSFALARLDEKLLHGVAWHRIVVDEAQNIKNPQSAQTRAITKLPAVHRLALTGTPVENRLRDLWSIFNFLNPGYLGKEAQFRKGFEIPIQRENDAARAAALKKLVEPFILRRLKTDRQIIRDLPDKVEQKVYCTLTAEQASLYEAVVRDVEAQLESADGIGRRGLILATLMKLKQVCNHPAQFLHDGSEFTGERSAKLERLTEMLEEVISEGESALIFTQFTESGAALERHIRQTLHCTTHYLHGGTSPKRREQMVESFQNPEAGPAVFVLSVRAGGTGLTLTRANHVFHFDRWWNPAVEDQATDRAFRIGQQRNVFAHKFVSLGTVEERIDQMIEDKKGLAGSIVGSDESWLTELDNDTFRDLIALSREPAWSTS